MTLLGSALSAYSRDAAALTTPVQRLTMLYDRLMLDLDRAVEAQDAGEWLAASAPLIHAQDIVVLLSSTLRDGLWDGSEELRSVYEYVNGLLVRANVDHKPALTRECIALLTPISDAWHEAAAMSAGAPLPEAGADA